MNKTQLLGRLTRDPELKYTNSNMAYTKFSLAVNRRFTKQGEERQADFINIIAWGKTAEFCAKYFQKGSQIAIDGRIQTGSYDKEGTRIYTFDVVAESVYFTGSNNGGAKKGDASEPKQNNNNNDEGEFEPVDDSELPF